MNRIISKILPFIVILTLVGVVLVPDVANAWIEGPIKSVFNNFFAIFLNTVLEITALSVYATGILLSVSINLTMHIGDIFKGSDALREIWVLVRNLSSMGIIFLLLYTSILTIVGVKGSSDIKALIGKIIISGLLINFSLFFVGIAVDASNLVSLQFYRAIAPDSTTSHSVMAAINDGGLSNVFMNSLRIPTIYQQKGVFSGTDVFASMNIAMAGGVMMMITAAFSFLGASIAFVSRTAILILVMALSPIYFAAMVFPQLEDKSKQIMKLFTSQLIFMPVYLFLMYVALRFIGSDSFSTVFNKNVAGGTGAVGTTSVTPAFIGTLVQYAIALFFINLPLVTAISMGAVGAKMVPNMNSVTGWFKKKGSSVAGGAWRRTGGALASSAANSNFLNKSASTNFITSGALKGLRNVAKSYNETEKKIGDERAKYGESLGYDKDVVYKHESDIRSEKDKLGRIEIKLKDPTIEDETTIKELKEQQKEAKANIRKSEAKISEEKNARQIAYAKRLDPRDIDPKTGKLKPMGLFGRLVNGKRNELVSAERHIKNTEAEIAQLTESLNNKKEDINTIKADMKSIDVEERRNDGVLNDKQKEKRAKLKSDLFELLNGVKHSDIKEDAKNVMGSIELEGKIRAMKQELDSYKKLK